MIFLPEITRYQRVELNGRTYSVVWCGDRARVELLTKRGSRTLNGYGRAYRPALIAQVIAKAQSERSD